jgi:DNA-binding response OmpR family regulator
MTASVLLVQKANPSVDWILQSLERKGYTVSLVRSQQKAIRHAASKKPDLIILNATSSRMNGPKICRALHRKVEEIPIILILPEGQKGDFSMGATVVLTSPFTSRKLFNRIRIVLESDRGEIIQVGGLTLSLGKQCVIRGSRQLRLNPKEFELLKVFMRSPGRVLSRKFLMKKVWKTDYMGDTRTLDVHIRWVREKIEKDPASPTYLRTVRGVGYRFDVPEETGEETK